ncbi:MAG: glutamyl-tRNA reductase [Actinomycetota bacterium]|nr:glutamyl-tRNA reductase [Actinomycetota bacterium]
MSVLLLGLNHKTAPVGLLERVAVPAERLAKALRWLTDREHVVEAVVLSTCNRVEVYAHVTRYHGGMADLRAFFAEFNDVDPEDFSDRAYDYYDNRAAAHLFAVASGLDSMVVGERQIHLQVRQALREAQDGGAAGRVLQALFSRALRVGKRVRAETAISCGASSMVDVGLDAARRILGDLQGRSVLVVGAGKLGGMAAARLGGVAGRLLIANRSEDKGRRLAVRVGAELLSFADLAEGLRDCDLVLTSTGSSGPVLDADTVAAAMAARPDRPLALVDLALPRNVDPACAALPGVAVLDIDVVRALSDTGPTHVEVAKAQALVGEEVERFAAWSRAVRLEPTIAALRARAEQVRVAEIERVAGRLGDLSQRQRDALEALTKGIVNTLLHEPSVRLKARADAGDGELQAAALRELFDLPG